MTEGPVEWVWERTDEEVEALYRRAAGRAFPWSLVVAWLAVPLLGVAAGLAIVPANQAHDPVGFAIAAGVVLFFALNALPGLTLRRRARQLRRLLEARGLGVERRLHLRREPWGLVVGGEHGTASMAWSTLSFSRSDGWWEGRHRGRPWLDLPDREPVSTMVVVPTEPAPFPEPPAGTVTWRSDRASRDAWTRANGTGTPQTFVLWSVLTSSVAVVAGLAAARSDGWLALGLWLGAGSLVLSRLAVFARWWRTARALPLGDDYESHVSNDGVMSGSEGLRTFTPWKSVTAWWPRGDFVFVNTTGGVWHVVPADAVPADAEAWFEAARATRRAERRREVPPAAPGRDNPFEPPRE